MCGIFGFTGVARKDVERAHKALNTLAHRGPDGWSYVHTGGVYVGHRRLSINDLSVNGTQPMVHGNVQLTVNGEIYNFKELRAELERDFGVKFKSQSDSEVLLHGYIHWGFEPLLERVDGMFALVIYDVEKHKVLLARDHAGIKPLYYSLLGGALGWASELKALVNYIGPKYLKVDVTAVYDFMTYLCVPAPKSMFEGIFKLEPAEMLVFDVAAGEVVEKKRYWQLPVRRDVDNGAVAKKMLKEALEKTVAEQLVADVPVGSFLSGGTDSSIVSYEAARLVPELNTCSISFEDEAVDETAFARMVAEVIHSKHRVAKMGQGEVNRDFALLKQWFDEPFGDTSAFPTQRVSALAKEKMTVVLTGDGGDELFGGYVHYVNWYQALTPWLGFLFPLRRPIAWLKNHSTGLLARLARKVEVFTLLDPLERQVRLRGGVLRTDALKVAYRQAFGMPENYDDLWYVRQFYRKDLPLKSRYMYLDFHTFMVDSILTKVDRASMTVAIETRVPFLAKRVVETAWRISERLLFKDGELKGLLKELYAGVLPWECLYRKKQGFSVGKVVKGDVLELGGCTLPEVMLRRLFPELVKGI